MKFFKSMGKKLVGVYIILFVITYSQLSQAQPDIKKVLKGGIELAGFLASQTGSFLKEPGYTFGYLTGIRLYGNSNSAILLGIDLNYTKIVAFRTKVSYTDYQTRYTANRSYNETYRDLDDERYKYSVLDLGLPIEYYVSIDNNTTLVPQ